MRRMNHHRHTGDCVVMAGCLILAAAVITADLIESGLIGIVFHTTIARAHP